MTARRSAIGSGSSGNDGRLKAVPAHPWLPQALGKVNDGKSVAVVIGAVDYRPVLQQGPQVPARRDEGNWKPVIAMEFCRPAG